MPDAVPPEMKRRYQNDPGFYNLVNLLSKVIGAGEATAEDLRDALIVAEALVQYDRLLEARDGPT